MQPEQLLGRAVPSRFWSWSQIKPALLDDAVEIFYHTLLLRSFHGFLVPFIYLPIFLKNPCPAAEEQWGNEQQGELALKSAV